jgi:membrane-bound inhibitor of C-type lysozyme
MEVGHKSGRIRFEADACRSFPAASCPSQAHDCGNMRISATKTCPMRNAILRPALPLLACLSLLLAGCGGFSIWPFGDKDQGPGGIPPNATKYSCAAGKSFYLRYLESGAAWIIYPDREVRLDKLTTEPGTRFSNGIATLEITGNEATLNDGPSVSYTGCKTANDKARG